MNLIELAHKLRPIIEKAMESVDDSTALEATTLFQKWNVDKDYSVGVRVNHDNVLYKVIQAHTSQIGWEPNVATSLFAKVLIPDPNDIPEWVQPDSTNAYMIGDKVRYKGDIYESLIDNNVWSPEAYPSGWKKVDLSGTNHTTKGDDV